MKYEIERNDLDDILSDLKQLDEKLTDMISDLHQVKGGASTRHSFMYYRKFVWDVRDKIKTRHSEIIIKQDTKEVCT